MFIFISGTSGSGKSLYAEKRLAEFSCEKKFYVATAKIFDDEMKARVENHKLMRKNKNFITIEREKNLGELNFPKDSAVLIEALTTWLANEMFDSGNWRKIFDDFQKLKNISGDIILVSDDIFSDGVNYGGETEIYVRNLAALTIKFAAIADEVIECVSGLILRYN